MSEPSVECGTLDSSEILKREEAQKTCQGQSKSTTVSRLVSLLIGSTEIELGGGDGRVGQWRRSRVSRLAVTISVKMTKTVGGRNVEGQKGQRKWKGQRARSFGCGSCRSRRL
jgi:hypothetical protein